MGRVDTGEVFSGVYKITNLINGKFYIGQSVDVNYRLYCHKTSSNENSAIDKAIRKYGKENFKYEVLERCKEDELLQKERFWAEEIFGDECYAPRGYNIGRTGIGGMRINWVSQYDLDGNKIDSFYNSNEAGRKMGVSGVAIRQAINTNGLCCESQWRYGDVDSIEKYVEPDRGVGVDCYDDSGNLKLSFTSGVEAAKFFNITPSAISSFVLHKPGYRTCNGFYLSKSGETPDIRGFNTDNHYRVKCYEYDLNTRELKKNICQSQKLRTVEIQSQFGML